MTKTPRNFGKVKWPYLWQFRSFRGTTFPGTQYSLRRSSGDTGIFGDITRFVDTKLNLVPLTRSLATLAPHDIKRRIDICPRAAFFEEIGGA